MKFLSMLVNVPKLVYIELQPSRGYFMVTMILLRFVKLWDIIFTSVC